MKEIKKDCTAGTTYLSQKSFLNPPLHQPGEVSVVFHIQMSSDYRGAAW